MPAIADLLDPRTAERLAEVRAQAAERERTAAAAVTATPVQPVCPTCGARRQVPEAVFSDR